MCDENTVEDNKKYLKKAGWFSRRQFSKLTAGSALAMLLPRVAHALDMSERDVIVPTPDGTADCYFVAPSSGTHPGVLMSISFSPSASRSSKDATSARRST